MKDVYDEYREPPQGCGTAIAGGLAIVAIIVLGTIMLICQSCGSTKHIEKVNYIDSVVMHHHYDTTHVQVTDTSHVEQHIVVTDTSYLFIQFGAGGGTYNAKTGLATNVTGVQESKGRTEQRDSIADLRQQLEVASAAADSLKQQVSNYSHELEEERVVPKRSGYDKFCSWWFWITAILILIKIAAWVMEKIPMTAPYIIIARKFVPFL